jgi:hypothetical protein
MPLKYLAAAAAAAPALLTACAAGGSAGEDLAETGLEAALAGFERSGEVRRCVNTRTIESIDPIDETHFLVEMRTGETYLNIVRGNCNDADSPFTVLEYSLSSTQLCQSEIIRVRDRSGGFVRGSCSLGQYELLNPIE